MIREKNQFVRLPLAMITFALVLGVLSMIWPAIMALFLGVLLLLLHSFGGELGVVVLP